MDTHELVSFFGMSESKAQETVKNPALSSCLKECVELYLEFANTKEAPKKVANSLYSVGSKLKPSLRKHLRFIIQYVAKGELDSEPKITAALKYLLDHLNEDEIDKEKFEESCGVGVVVTDDDIENYVQLAMTDYRNEIIENRYRFNMGKVLARIRTFPKMMWADGARVKNEADQQLIVLLGPKTDEDMKQPSKSATSNKDKSAKKGKEVKQVAKPDPALCKKEELTPQERIMNILVKLPFHKPGANYTTDGYPTSSLAMNLLSLHLKQTGGQVRTRFPPEPNGILHIGHAKAININFGYAKAHNGICFLRYDDTNPEKEEERFFKSISEMVQWLGYTPYKITHASDYFDELYAFAKVLVGKGLAYVCHQTPDEMKGTDVKPSPWRNRSIEENMILFENMKNGMYEEGEATLRMKIRLEEGKLDPVAYRIRYVPHPKAGTKWCIYPTYDFTHCLCDSLENITHSMCTKEFQNRRSSYYWLCEAVETYIPVQWEYGRLNMCYTVVSKRKIAKLIDTKMVSDWDDPRLFTLPALRRRGFPPEAINEFCLRMGVTGATISVEPAMLEACVRDNLNLNAPRTMVVLEPLRINITNFSLPEEHKIDVPDFPSNSDSKCHKVSLQKVIYIEKSDFRMEPEKGYKRFSPNQPVGLRHAGLILTYESCETVNDEVVSINASASKIGEPGSVKPKGFIHWVSDPIEIEVRIYDSLFKSKNPEDVPNGFLEDCNINSMTVLRSYADKHIKSANVFSQYQFERIGFFSVDPDTSADTIVLNRTVTLKEDNEKT